MPGNSRSRLSGGVRAPVRLLPGGLGPWFAVLLVLATLWAPPRSQAAEEAGNYTVLLEAASVGGRLRTPGTKPSAGPRPRAAVDSIARMRLAVARGQQPVRASIEAVGATVLGSTQAVLNAFFVRATAEQADAIARLEGVRGVVPGQRYSPLLRTASEIVGAGAVHRPAAGTARMGDGLKIGIIDSGLDFEHEAFHDDSLPELFGYPLGDTEYRHLASPKVVVVRSYVHMLNSGRPRSSTPDDESPWDRSGHGTGVAMIAAGNLVHAPLGPVSGIAPKARIGVYKVFGTPGLNYYTNDRAVIAALDSAVVDGMNIVNLSLGNPMRYPWDARGSDCGNPHAEAHCSPLAEAAQTLAEDLGVVVVAAAGNRGLAGLTATPARSTILVPGNAPGVITVGGTGNAAHILQSVQVGEQSYRARSGTGPDAHGPLTEAAVLAEDLGNARACEPFPADSLVGALVVIERGVCFFVDKVEHADAAGAVGVLVTNHSGEALVKMALLEDTDIPAFMVGLTDGEAIREAIRETGAALTLDPTPVVSEEEWAFVAPRSSRGPNLALLPKPDLVAPGLNVYTAAPRFNEQATLFTPDGFRTNSGTSLAAPMVAGAAALVWQEFPELTARQVASALVNTARRSILEDDEPARLSSAGAGLLDVQAALRPGAAVVPPTVGFGSVANGALPVRKTLEVTNRSDRPQSFWIDVEPRDSDFRAYVTVNGRFSTTIRLAARDSLPLRVELRGRRPVPGSYEGALRFVSLSGNGELHVPYLYVVGSNEPHDAVVLRGGSATGLVGQVSNETVIARVLDRVGVPVAGHPVRFVPGKGTPQIRRVSRVTTPNGLLYASVRYGPEPDPQTVIAKIGDLNITFQYTANETEPSLTAIGNGAWLDSQVAVAGSLVSLAGAGFARHPSGPVQVGQGGLLPLRRKGASVSFDAPDLGVSVAGRIASVSPDTLMVQVPWELAGGSTALVKVRTANPSAPLELELAPVAPGIFHTLDDQGALASALLEDGTAVSSVNPAPRGQSVTLLMTGNGPVESTPDTGAAGSAASLTVHPPVVRMDGRIARVLFSGLDPAIAGLYLVTAVVPSALQPGLVRLQVKVAGASSNTVRLPVR